ncbi:50S ribosomal protein L18, partial [Escherichia coli]|nr:50S ribosomal protein L18 [Escherichia coli]
MITKADKNAVRKKRHARVRAKLSGTAARPRLNVYRSNKHIYAQLIDDVNGVTVASASTQDKEVNLDATGNVDAAVKVGE